MKYQPVIGLEIHCELLTSSKVFCSCQNEFGGGENTRVCPRCSGMPGALPILNKNAVCLAAKAGFATDCTVNRYSAFDRKNYFYPDLPKAYQITQFEYPICSNGFITVCGGKKIRINRIHIEEDAGKLIHDDTENISMADYNRCGVPLIEIVTEPDFRRIEEVRDFTEQIALRLKYADVCDAKMEQGSLRVDVNISVMPQGSAAFGTRAEIKNLNSLKSISRAIEFETERQSEILNNGGKIAAETRRFDERTGKTYPLRSKEEAHDYRYFPEPDIPPVILSESDMTEIKNSIPELPHIRFKRYTEDYKLPYDDAKLITASRAYSDFYDKAVKINSDYRRIATLMLVEVNRILNNAGIGIEDVLFTPDDIAELVKMSSNGIVSKNAAKDILKLMSFTGGKPMDIARENGFIMSCDTEELEKITDKIISEYHEQAESYKNGNDKIFGFLMGLVMRFAGKGANPKTAREILSEKLK